MGRYKSDEVKHAQEKCQLANRIFMLEMELKEVKADRDEWKKQHENFLSVRDADIAALSKRIAKLENMVKRCKRHITQWWRPDGELPPAGSPQLIEDIDTLLRGNDSKEKAHE